MNGAHILLLSHHLTLLQPWSARQWEPAWLHLSLCTLHSDVGTCLLHAAQLHRVLQHEPCGNVLVLLGFLKLHLLAGDVSMP